MSHLVSDIFPLLILYLWWALDSYRHVELLILQWQRRCVDVILSFRGLLHSRGLSFLYMQTTQSMSRCKPGESSCSLLYVVVSCCLLQFRVALIVFSKFVWEDFCLLFLCGVRYQFCYDIDVALICDCDVIVYGYPLELDGAWVLSARAYMETPRKLVQKVALNI